MGFLLILLVSGLAIFGVPIGVALIASSMFYILSTGNIPSMVTIQKVSAGSNSFMFVAVPLFVLAGHIMEETGITDRLIEVSKAFVGHIAGGLAHVNVVVSMLFAGVSGAALADTAAIGGTLIPVMKREGFDAPFSVAITAASSLIGPVIPPSIPMVVYGGIAGVSIGKLFLGGVIPGIIMGLYMIGISYYLAKKRGYPRHAKASWKERVLTIYKALSGLLMPIIVIGGIVLGFFTSTEASVIAVVYGVFLGVFVLKSIDLRTIVRILNKTANTTSAVMLVVGGATLFGYVLTIEGVPGQIINWLMGFSDNPQVILMLICFFLLLVGMFMSVNAALVVVSPILLPIVNTLGIDLIQFGVLMVVCLSIGLLTPPVCNCLQLACQIGEIPLMDGFKETFIFIVAMFLLTLAMVFFPPLVTFLPNLLMG